MIRGDLPPSSRVTRFRFDSPAARRMRWPTAEDPVKATLSTSGCMAMCSPQVGPSPVRRLMTPGGKPASLCATPHRVNSNALGGKERKEI